MVSGGGSGYWMWFIRLGRPGLWVAFAVVELNEVALSQPKLDIPGQGVFLLSLLYLKRSWGDPANRTDNRLTRTV